MQQRASDISKTKFLVSPCMGVRHTKDLTRNKNKRVGRFFSQTKTRPPQRQQRKTIQPRKLPGNIDQREPTPQRAAENVREGRSWHSGKKAALYGAVLLCSRLCCIWAVREAIYRGAAPEPSLLLRSLSGEGGKTQINHYFLGDSVHHCTDSPYAHRCRRVGHRPRQIIPLPIVEMVLVRVSGPKQRRPE